MLGQPDPISLSLPDSSLSLHFRWEVDRFVQSIDLCDGRSLKQTIEDNSQIWPAAPPIQQLSLEHIDHSPVALGVGSAGKSHWSMSAEIGRIAGKDCFVFDCACRVKEQPGFLGTAYTAIDPGVINALESEIDQELGVIEVTDLELRILPTISAQPGQTARWRYRIAAR